MMHNYNAELSALTLGQEVSTLNPFPTGEGQLIIPPEVEVELELPVDEELPGLPPGFIAPGGVPVRPENWNLDAEPFATYVIASGDTFVGLAKTYLGNGARWVDIWKTGNNQAKFPDPDVITNPGPLDMPAEAADNLRNWLKKGKPTTPPGTTPKEKTVEKATRLLPFLIVGGVVGLLAATAIGAARRG